MRLPLAHPAPSLLLHDLELRAAGGATGRVLITQLNMSVVAGERWVVLGPNGAGKSTLLAAFAGLIRPKKGRIQLGDRNLNEWTSTALARQRAWCPQFWQDPFPVSALETASSAAYATSSENADVTIRTARDALVCVDASSFAQQDVRMLSGGERQRVALATAFAQRAPLLLLDEPTSHLDWSHQALLRELLVDWSAQNGTVVAAVHDLNFAWALATHVLLLDGRGGAWHGTRDQLLEPAALTRAYGVPISIRDEGHARWFRVELRGREDRG